MAHTRSFSDACSRLTSGSPTLHTLSIRLDSRGLLCIFLDFFLGLPPSSGTLPWNSSHSVLPKQFICFLNSVKLKALLGFSLPAPHSRECIQPEKWIDCGAHFICLPFLMKYNSILSNVLYHVYSIFLVPYFLIPVNKCIASYQLCILYAILSAFYHSKI